MCIWHKCLVGVGGYDSETREYIDIYPSASLLLIKWRTVEMCVTVYNDQSPVRGKSRAQDLSTSTSSISSPKDYNSLGSSSSSVDHCHSIYNIHKVNGMGTMGERGGYIVSLQEMVFYLISLAKGARPRRWAPVLAASFCHAYLA